MKLHEAWNIMQSKSIEDDIWHQALDVLAQHLQAAEHKRRHRHDQQLVTDAATDVWQKMRLRSRKQNATFGCKSRMETEGCVKGYLFNSVENKIKSTYRKRGSQKAREMSQPDESILAKLADRSDHFETTAEKSGFAIERESRLVAIERHYERVRDEYCSSLETEGRQARVIAKSRRLLAVDLKLVQGAHSYEDVMDELCEEPLDAKERNRIQQQLSRVRAAMLKWSRAHGELIEFGEPVELQLTTAEFLEQMYRFLRDNRYFSHSAKETE